MTIVEYHSSTQVFQHNYMHSMQETLCVYVCLCVCACNMCEFDVCVCACVLHGCMHVENMYALYRIISV